MSSLKQQDDDIELVRSRAVDGDSRIRNDSISLDEEAVQMLPPLHTGPERIERQLPVCCRYGGLGVVLLDSKLNWLLLCGIPAILTEAMDSMAITFVLSVLTLIPLAASLGLLTEQLALHSNDTIGGLMNATFGNATELIISVLALKHNLPCVVQQSLLGSILSNELLVLGTAFFVGGVKFRYQTYNKDIMSTSCGLLLLAVMGLLIPASLQASRTDRSSNDLALSHFTAFILLSMYGAYLYFQLKTHVDLFDAPPPPPPPAAAAPAAASSNSNGVGNHRYDDDDDDDDDDDEEEEILLTFWQCVGWLTVITLLVALYSDFLVRAIEPASKDLGIPRIFIAVIIIPIVGNACEHASAVTCAAKNKMDLALGIAIGSSTQIALFGVPLMVVVAWMMGVHMSMNFQTYQSMSVFTATIIVTVVTSDGRSHWLRGLLLMMTYVLVGAGFWAHTDVCNET